MSSQQLCVKCSQGITNPVCEQCYTKELAIWLNDADVNPRIISYIVKEVRKNFSLEGLNDGLCIICGNDIVSVCTYCFFFKVEQILRNSPLSRQMVDDFLEFFNYKLYTEENLLGFF